MDDVVYEATEMPKISIGKNALGQPVKLRLQGALQGEDLNRLALLLEDRGLEFTEREYWQCSARGDTLTHGVRPSSRVELTVGQMRAFVASIDANAPLYLDIAGEHLRSLGVDRVRVLEAYPDTTDENGKWGSAFKLRLTSQSPLPQVNVGMLRVRSALCDPEQRVVLVTNRADADIGPHELSRYLTTLAASRRVVGMRSNTVEPCVIFETEKKP